MKIQELQKLKEEQGHTGFEDDEIPPFAPREQKQIELPVMHNPVEKSVENPEEKQIESKKRKGRKSVEEEKAEQSVEKPKRKRRSSKKDNGSDFSRKEVDEKVKSGY